MGCAVIKKEIQAAIDNDKPDDLILLLKAHPHMVNQEINSTSHHTPLMRAVWKQNFTMVNIMLADFEANPNKFCGKYSPLMVAAIKGNIEIIE